MDTVVTKKYHITKEEFDKIVFKTVSDYEDTFVKAIGNLIEELSEKSTLILNRNNLCLDIEDKFIWIDSVNKILDASEERINKVLEKLEKKCFYANFPFELSTKAQAEKIIKFNEKKYEKIYKVYCYKENGIDYYYNSSAYYDSAICPVINLRFDSIRELLVKYLIPYDLRPLHISDESYKCLSDLINMYKIYPRSLDFNKENNKVLFRGGTCLLKGYKSNFDKELKNDLNWKLVHILEQAYKNNNIMEIEPYTKEILLNCEKIRADIDSYEERLLTDPNRGHWDLWDNGSQPKYTIETAAGMVARNPLCDINENGVIAIDFGTKSTVVVYQSDIEYSLPMGIGDGKISKNPTPKRYENPTIMHFVNLDTFLKDYKSKKGRPKTKWVDLTISHTAKDQFDTSKSEEYYEYFSQIKQWAGQRGKQFRVKSRDGKTYLLPTFLDLDDNEFNPIELYAYYIGLYINNMIKGHGIFLDYYLSFPVTYEKKIREKIIRSFEKGIKKSLPESILENEEVMKRFHINGDISEPAAYAVCALQEYGFEPEKDEEVFYSIFDFGGGTTDFDFGLWKQSQKRRYDYAIENFGSGGDEYLGGENLLQILAFEIFKANQDLMRKKGYTFTLAPKCKEFLGSDSILADSQEAEKNMNNLLEKIRPYWELPTSSQTDNVSNVEPAQEDDNIEFTVTLFNKEGQDNPGEKLFFSKKKLYEIIETKIRDGVKSFFTALMLSYQNERVKKPTKVNILLAGNSCKSPIVKRIFEEEIAKQEEEIIQKYNIENTEHLFEIFPPLGTNEAYDKMESRGIIASRNDFEKPTGKTGVAFGLIQCRAGGAIERITNSDINNEVPFQYFIGWRSRKKFVVFNDDNKLTRYIGKPDYNEWHRFVEADDSIFDLYYTTLPDCVEGDLLVDGNAAVKRLRCEIDVVDKDAFVYIRAVDPYTLEYVVARDYNVDSSKLGSIVRKEL